MTARMIVVGFSAESMKHEVFIIGESSEFSRRFVCVEVGAHSKEEDALDQAEVCQKVINSMQGHVTIFRGWK